MKTVIKQIKLVIVALLAFTYMGCDDDDVVLPEVEAQFTQTINQNRGIVTFINASENADSFAWDFGDGTTSTEVNPIKVYESGTFTVTLEASNIAGASATFQDEIVIDIPDIFDSGLLVNGDFSNGGDPWIGNALNVVTEGDNSFNLANVEAAGNPFDVNLSQVVELTQGTNYILTFEASSDRERTILAGIGLNEAPFTSTAPSVNLTTTTQVYTLQLSAADFGGANSRVLFDMGAEVGTVVIDNVNLVEGGDGSDSIVPFDSGLLVNGGFENGSDPWIGNAVNVQTEGGNSFNLANVEAAGNPFDVNLSQVVEITQGTNYILTFDASSDRERTILAGIGLNEAPFTNTAPVVNLTASTQTFTLQLSAADFGGANSRVLFDMGADVGTVVLDNVRLEEGGDGSDSNTDTPPPPFDSGLLTNGDFEAGAAPWTIGVGADPAPVVTVDGNTFYQVDVATAGNAFDVNTSQRGLAFTNGMTYTLTFDAWTDATTASRDIIAGIGRSGGDFANTTEAATITSTRQTFTLNLTATFDEADGRVLFDSGAAIGQVNIDNVSLVLDDTPPPPPPFDSGLLTNGDFEAGAAPWTIGVGADPAPVVTVDDNTFYQVDVAAAGNAFDVNTSQRGLAFTNGMTYTLTFDAWTDATTASRDIIAGIGRSGGDFANTTEAATITSTRQTFTLNLMATFDEADGRVLFDSGAAIGQVNIDNVSLVLDSGSGGGGGGPMGGCTDTPVDATMLPATFEACETFLGTFTNDGSITTELAANPSVSGLNTSANVLRINKAIGTSRFAGVQNAFPNPDVIGDLATTTLRVLVYSNRANVSYRFGVNNNPNEPGVGLPAEVTVVAAAANEWVELEVNFVGIPPGFFANQIVIKPDNPTDIGDTELTTEDGVFFIDNIRIE